MSRIPTTARSAPAIAQMAIDHGSTGSGIDSHDPSKSGPSSVSGRDVR